MQANTGQLAAGGVEAVPRASVVAHPPAESGHHGVRPNRYRAIFISDTHLGTRGCKAHHLLDFLRHHESDHLYLVGDIIDGWALRDGFYWPQCHNDVVQKVLRRARKGTQVVYVPGNHDEFARQFVGLDFGGIAIRAEAEHRLLDGRRLWVVHGDFADGVIQHARWLAYVGDSLYGFALWLNRHVNTVRARLGMQYWSLSQYLKHKVKNAVGFIFSFFVGLVSVEKDIDAFLELDLPGSKVVAGDGPALAVLRRRHPEVRFLGMLDSRQLARLYSAADVFVFPSRTDTFGLVLLEALACGLPVAAYPVQGPLDVVGKSDVAVLDEDLERAALAALRIDRRRCREFALERSWRNATIQFVALLQRMHAREGFPPGPKGRGYEGNEDGP